LRWRRVLSPVAAAFCVLVSACAEPEPRRDFVMQIADYPRTLDPAQSYDFMSTAVVGKVFTGLLTFDPQTLELRPELAESYEVLDEGRVLRFHLRRGARFHHGREVTAEDFRFAFERLLRQDPPAPAAWILHPLRGAVAFARGEAEEIAGLEVEDPHTLKLELEIPFSPFLQHLAMPSAAAMARETTHPGALPSGTGPFRVESADPERGVITLGAFDDYHRGAPTLESIELRVIADPGRALESYWQGELDMLAHLPVSFRTAWRSELGAELHQWPILTLNYLVPSADRLPPEILPRRALAQAIDRQALCDEVLQGNCQPAAGILPPGIQGHDPMVQDLPHRPEAAAELLAEAGHPEGRGLGELGLWVQERVEQESVAYAIAGQLARVGLRVDVRPVPWAELLEVAVTGQYDLLLIPWTADYPDPDNFLFPLLHGSQCGVKNYACYQNPEFDRLVDAARTAGSDAERVELYQRAERLALQDAPFVPLYYPYDAVVLRTGWRGLTLHPMGWQEIPLELLSWRSE